MVNQEQEGTIFTGFGPAWAKNQKELHDATELKTVRGRRTTFEDGRSVFVGTDGTDVFIEYSKDGYLTPIRLSPEAAYETAELIQQIMVVE